MFSISLYSSEGFVQFYEGCCRSWNIMIRPSCILQLCHHHFFLKSEAKLIDNYSPLWRWLEVDIYQAMQQQGKYPALAIETEMNSCFSIFYNNEIILVAQKDGFYWFIPAMITIFLCANPAQVVQRWKAKDVGNLRANQRATSMLSIVLVYISRKLKWLVI